MKIPCLYEFKKERLKIRYPNQDILGRACHAEGMAVKKGSCGRLDIYDRVKP